MSAFFGLGTYGNAAGVVTPEDFKLAQGGLVVKSGSGFGRAGLFWNGNATIVSGTAGMAYSVAQYACATRRTGSTAMVFGGNDGTIASLATTAAPGSNSRYDVVYHWHREYSLDGTDSNPVIGVVQGTAAASPTAPSLAAYPGAIELARILVPAGVTATNSGTTITQTAPFTAMAGGVVAFRTTTERDAGTYIEGQLGWLIDSNTMWSYTGSQWSAMSDALVCRVTRASNAPTVSSVSPSDLSANANWVTTSPGQNVGFAAYSSGITVPVAGVYRVGYSLVSQANIALLTGVTVNKNAAVGYTDFKVPLSSTPVGSVVGATASDEILLAAGDVLRPYALAASGTPALVASMGDFYASWVRAA